MELKLNAAWLASAAVAFVIAIAVYLGIEQNPEREVTPKQEPYQQMFDSANTQIVEESRGRIPERTINTAARPSNTLRENPPTVESKPQPPDGYSFVEFHGEMSKARLKERGTRKGVRPIAGLEWLGSATSIDELKAQGVRADRDWSFGWLRMAEDVVVNELATAIRSTGAAIVGGGGRLIRVKLPSDETRLRAIAALSEVDGIGAAPPELKLRAVERVMSEIEKYERIPVLVTLMSGDSQGHWRNKLKEIGAVVGHYDPTIRVVTVSASYDVLKAIAMTDFVSVIEPISFLEAAHDTAVPAMGADALRTYTGSPFLFAGIGGITTPIGVMDSGLNTQHEDISSHRSSICGANFVFLEPRVDDHDLWWDAGNHGTHVTGTIVGNGTAEPRYTAMAPLVQHIRFAKVLGHQGFGHSIFILRGMDFLAEATSCPEGGWLDTRVKPLIVNMSLSGSARVWEGRGVAERKLDSIVWRHRQLYVVAQSNEGISGFSNYGTAKNSLAVGAALDSGSLAVFSSHGPTADGRLAPQVVGAGVDVYSPAGDGSSDGYNRLSGTSMASPAVAGVAALLMEAIPAHREQPALVRARLMASAIKPDPWLETPALFPTENSNGPGTLQMQYGLGKVSARTSILNREGADGWSSGSAISELEDGEYAYQDIEIPEGTARLELVLTWDEPPTDTLASAVLNDLDLWLDRGGDCFQEPCGEHASTSRIDNVEWIIVTNPAPGTYRAKVVASRVYTDPPRAALAWTVIRGATSPQLEISVDKELIEFEERGEQRELTFSVTTDGYIAAGTQLFIDCRTANGADCLKSGTLRVSHERVDGIDPEIQLLLDAPIFIGELAVGTKWRATIAFKHLAPEDENAFRLYLKASSWNAHSDAATVLMRTSGTDEADIAEEESPENEQFANASLISGERGTVGLELIRAQTEMGEPVSTPRSGRPAGSVWYEWTAPSNDKVSFHLVPDAGFDTDRASRVDVFTGNRIANLTQIASADWGVQFFTVSGQTYKIRVSHASRSIPLELKWSVGPRPENDHFLTASIIEGSDGSIEGTNAGATLEGELFGTLAATVWYRWTAPLDGSWEFSTNIDDLSVLAFTGENLRDLRLVSAYPSGIATFDAHGGEEYFVVVASEDAYATGLAYELKWYTVDRELGNDLFRNAEEIHGEASSSYPVNIDVDATVEPGEPIESGIRTKWWSWSPPVDGEYTWRIEELTRPTEGPGIRMMVSVFAGSNLNDLQFVASNGTEMSVEWVFSARGGQQYWLVTGFPADFQWAFMNILRHVDVTLEWGPTPTNDRFSSATLLSGMSGSVTASNLFATTERGERTAQLGHSSLWWRFDVPETGWYRFWVEGGSDDLTFAVYEGGGELTSLDLVESRRGPPREVMFRAEAETVYTIRIGTYGSAPGQEFTLIWEATEPPLSMRYVGRLYPGGPDAAGDAVELHNLSSLTLNSEGDALYLGSDLGLQVFERNSETGMLTFRQLLEGTLHLRRLVWDEHRDRLLSVLCLEWRVFVPVDDGSVRLQDSGRLTISDNNQVCNEEKLFIDSSGSFIYLVATHPDRLQALEFTSSDSVRHIQTLEIDKLRAAILANNDDHVYALSDDSLLSFDRDVESGELTASGSSSLSTGNSLAISSDDELLFVFDENGRRANLMSLTDDADHPILVSELNQDEFKNCTHATTRAETSAVDVICGLRYQVAARSGAFTVEWRPGSGELLIENAIFDVDLLGSFAPDFFGTVDVAASPDGRHLYVATFEHGILVFERFDE